MIHRQNVCARVITLNIRELTIYRNLSVGQFGVTDFVLVEARRELSSETRVTSSATTPTASSSSTTAVAGGGGGGGSESGGASCVRGTVEGSGHGAPGPAPGPGDRHAEISRHQAHTGPALPAHRQAEITDTRLRL